MGTHVRRSIRCFAETTYTWGCSRAALSSFCVPGAPGLLQWWPQKDQLCFWSWVWLVHDYARSTNPGYERLICWGNSNRSMWLVHRIWRPLVYFLAAPAKLRGVQHV